MFRGDAPENPNVESVLAIGKQPEKMNKEELIREVINWRNVWSYIDDDVKSFLTQVGQPVVVTKRDGHSFHGTYFGMTTQIIEHKFKTLERIRDDVDKKFYIFENHTIVPSSNIVDFKFVDSKYEDTPDPYMEELERKQREAADSSSVIDDTQKIDSNNL